MCALLFLVTGTWTHTQSNTCGRLATLVVVFRCFFYFAVFCSVLLFFAFLLFLLVLLFYAVFCCFFWFVCECPPVASYGKDFEAYSRASFLLLPVTCMVLKSWI